MIARLIVSAAAVLAPLPAIAQALQCVVPQRLPNWKAEGPTAREPRRMLATAGYTLAVSWSPGYCRTNSYRPDARFQCGTGNRFDFVLHGLWPDGAGKDWPQYCRSVPALPAATVRRNICVTPSAQLIQHEWAKHGSCMAREADAYFTRSRGLFQGLRFPDMQALSRRPRLTAGQLATEVAKLNRGMTARSMRVTADRQGWLEELWICLDLQFRPKACASGKGGLAPGAAIKVWRGRR